MGLAYSPSVSVAHIGEARRSEDNPRVGSTPTACPAGGGSTTHGRECAIIGDEPTLSHTNLGDGNAERVRIAAGLHLLKRLRKLPFPLSTGLRLALGCVHQTQPTHGRI
jgi:hypothetical protein